MWETSVQSLGWEDPLEEGMATHLLQYSCLENPHGQRSLAGYSPWHSPGQNTGVGILSLLQGIFPTQGLNQGLPHCRRILYQLNHQGSLYFQRETKSFFLTRTHVRLRYFSFFHNIIDTLERPLTMRQMEPETLDKIRLSLPRWHSQLFSSTRPYGHHF